MLTNIDNIYKINLDQPPESRWNEVVTIYKSDILNALKNTEEMLNGSYYYWAAHNFFSLLSNLGLVLYSKELEGIAKTLDISVGQVALLQLAYEFCTCCTSIITKENGKVYHFRTMDWDMNFLKPLTINVEFMRDGEPIFRGTTWPGYVGILTGMKKNYSVSINYRRLNDSFLKNIYYGLTSCWPVSFLVRHTMTQCDTYNEAKFVLMEADLMAPVYIIMSGKENGHIITRDRLKSVQPLSLKENRMLVQTNIDHWRGDGRENDWQDIEFSRRRRKFAYQWLNNNEISVDNLWKLMYTKPVCASDTLYMTGMCVEDEYYETRLS